MTIIKVVHATAIQMLCLVMVTMVLVAFVGNSPTQAATIIINEILADPGADLAGDANGDGIKGTYDDEFIELVNGSDSTVDLTGWTLSDSSSVRHLFPAGTVLDPYAALVVFGGGSPSGSFGGALAQTASTGSLLLNNTGDSIILNDGTVDIVTVSYGGEGNDDQSLTLNPDIIGALFVKHSTATGSGGALFSPGTMVDGTPFAAPVPVPGAVVLLSSGLAMLVGLRRKHRS